VLVRIRAALEAFRDSLFFLPALFVVAAVALAQAMLALDDRVSLSVPSFLRFTVDSARALLSTVAGATVTVTGIVFALTALSVQLASSQFSPRVVRGFLRDRFAQLAIGFMSGTFTYSLVVLRAVRTPDGDASAVVPNLSAGLALVFAVGVVLMILAYVDHTAQSLQATHLIGKITRETIELVRRRFPEVGQGAYQPPIPADLPAAGPKVVAGHSGWLQQVSEAALLEALPAGATLRVDVRVGSFVHAGQRLSTWWSPEPGDDHGHGDDEGEEELAERLGEAFALGRARTMQQDVEFGLRQLVDIALRALSSGINDATTAYECIVHLGAVLYEILGRDLPPAAVEGDDGRRLLRPGELTHDDYVERAFGQIRRSAAPLPDISLALVLTLGRLAAELEEQGLAGRSTALADQARLVVSGVAAEGPLPEDLVVLHRALAEAGFAAGGR